MPLRAALPGIVAHHAGMRIHCDAALRAFKAAKVILAYAAQGFAHVFHGQAPMGLLSAPGEAPAGP